MILNKIFVMISLVFALLWIESYHLSIVQESMYIIDRFEDEHAVLERDDLTVFCVDRNQLPAEAKEGDVITLQWQINKSATDLIKNHIKVQYKDIWI